MRKRSDSNNNTRLSDQHHVGLKPPADVMEIEKECLKDVSLKSLHPRDNG
ncbi:hypothetical protein [Lysinibacillus xylanilyticus]